MKIHLPSYSQSVHQIEETVEVQDLDLDGELFVSAILAKLRLDRHDPYLDFKIELNACVHLDCDLCLEPFETTITAVGPMLYVLGNSPQSDDVDDSDVAYIPRNTTELDLTEPLRDMLILAIPSRRLCDEECRGLCSSCGANLNMHDCHCGLAHRGL